METGVSILIEMYVVGRSMEVRAVDESDGLEVAFIAPIRTPEDELRILSRRQLEYVRRKRAEKASQKDTKKPPRDDRGGILV